MDSSKQTANGIDTVDIDIDGFKLNGIDNPLRLILMSPFEGVSPVEGLPGSEEEVLKYNVSQNLVNMLLSALKLKELWKVKNDDAEFMEEVSEYLMSHCAPSVYEAFLHFLTLFFFFFFSASMSRHV